MSSMTACRTSTATTRTAEVFSAEALRPKTDPSNASGSTITKTSSPLPSAPIARNVIIAAGKIADEDKLVAIYIAEQLGEPRLCHGSTSADGR
jgi:hypothetical protein